MLILSYDAMLHDTSYGQLQQLQSLLKIFILFIFHGYRHSPSV